MFSLYKINLKTMSNIINRATKYLNAEDVLLALEEKREAGRHATG